MDDKKLKIIIDTNLWINFLISKDIANIDGLFENDTIEILFSDELIEEFFEVVRRPKLKKFFSDIDINALFRMFHLYGTMVKVYSKVTICRDTDDDFLLALAKDGNADYLITSDKDLLILKKFHQCRILTYFEFKKNRQKLKLERIFALTF